MDIGSGSGDGRQRRPRRAPRPVLLHLVALALVPALGMPVFAGLFVADHLADAAAARAIGTGMHGVQQLDDLRSAIAVEATAAGFAAHGQRFGLTVEQLEGIIGENDIVALEPARRATDAAVAAVEADQATNAVFGTLRQELVEVRRLADRASGEAVTSPADDPVWAIHLAYKRLQGSSDSLERTAILGVVTGEHGSGSSRLLGAVAQLEAAASIANATHQHIALVDSYLSAPTPSDRAVVQAGIRLTAQSLEERQEELSRQLSSRLRSEWHQLSAERAVERFHDGMRALATGDPDAPVGLGTIGIVDLGRDALAFTDHTRAFLSHAIDEGIAVARADQRTAEAQARTAVVATLALLGVTAVMVVTVGGRIRRRLGGLADAAERLRAGELEVMPVAGPREIAVAGEALNDAVENFRRVALHAEILASGDLDDPVLEEPVPGELGAAVHASVARILAALREGEELRDRLAHQATHDTLTGLPNRAEAERLLQRSLARTTGSGDRVALLFVDLDHFKRCNDTFGHAAGDHVLRTAASRMVAAVRPGDRVCRLGGDEFVVIVEPVPDDTVVDIARRIVALLAEPVPYQGGEITVGATVGVALSTARTDASCLLRLADGAMYRAKADGRGTVAVAAAGEQLPA